MHALTHVWEFLDLWLLMSSVDFKKAKYFVYRMTSSFYRVFQVFLVFIITLIPIKNVFALFLQTLEGMHLLLLTPYLIYNWFVLELLKQSRFWKTSSEGMGSLKKQRPELFSIVG